MADGKNSFVLYRDLKFTLDNLTDEKAGQLFKHILNYVNDLNPITDDIIIKIAFEPIKQSLKRDLKKWEIICKRNKDNGSKGGRPKNPEEPKKPNGLSGNPEEPKKPDSDTDSDTDSEKNKYNFIERFNSITGKKVRVLDEKTKRQFSARLRDGFSTDDIETAIKNCMNDKYHKENPKYLTPEFITRADKLQMYLNSSKEIEQKIITIL